jgi:uncharacterized protein (TIGR02646 family)
MIYVKRIESPEVFIKKYKAIQNEIKRAKDIYEIKGTPKPKNLFTFYSAQKNFYKDELIAMFRHRCAYCETQVTIGSRGDIEHFRPKGEFVTKEGKTIEPGYYWLAAKWENLYLSCTNCNQKSTLKILDANDPTKIIEQTVGKMNQFALKDEQYRIKDSQPTNLEDPYRLLIDPCMDNPEQLLEFSIDGNIKPRIQNCVENEMALYSINVFGLRRLELVEIRKQKYLEVADRAATISLLKDLVVDGFRKNKKTIQHNFNCSEMEKNFLLLMKMLDTNNPHASYIGAARQYAGSFLAEYSSFITTTLDPAQFKTQQTFRKVVEYFKPQVQALTNYFKNETI